MARIDAQARSAAIRGEDSPRESAQQEGTPGRGGLHRLLNRPSALDQLVGDAGPLGKYRTDQPDRMPSGTSALTLKVSDALNRLAARLGMPSERVLSGNPTLAAPVTPTPPTELPPGAGPTATRTDAALDPKPAVASSTDNSPGHIDRGNRHAAGT